MNDEIKEILDNMKEISSFEYTTDWFELNYEDTKILLDYITSLQQENERLKEQYDLVCKISEERKNKWLSLNDENEDLFYIAKDYKQENERLKQVMLVKQYYSETLPEGTEFVVLTKENYDRQQKDIQLELIDYKSRCEKAIKVIKNKYPVLCESEGDFKEELLNILQNGSEKDDKENNK